MKKQNNIIPQSPVIKTIPVPGKVSAKVFSINLAKEKTKDTSVKIRNKVKVVKSSGQKIKDYISLKYRIPYIDPDFIKLCYESNPEHTRCIKFKANCIIGAGIDIEPNDPGLKDFTNDAEYKILEDFTGKPINQNDEYLIDVLKASEEDYLNFGFGLIEIVKNAKNELSELYYFPSYEARLVYDESTEGKLFDKLSVIQLLNSSEAAQFSIFSESVFTDKNKERCVLLLRNINPFDRFYGFPEWYPATAKLALSRTIDEYNIRSFKNDLMISFAIIVEGGELGEGQESTITQFLSANYKGVANANRALYLASDSPDVKIRIERIQKDGREASFVMTQNQNTDSIVISHGVVGSLLGISKPGKLGNTSENYDLFQVMNETIIKPEQIKIQNKLNSIIRLGFGITKFKLVPKELTFEKLSEMVKYSTELTNANIIDDNEARQYLGYEPRTDDPATIETQIDNVAKEIRKIRKSIEE